MIVLSQAKLVIPGVNTKSHGLHSIYHCCHIQGQITIGDSFVIAIAILAAKVKDNESMGLSIDLHRIFHYLVRLILTW
jgi:hypothetical protein